MFRVDLGDHHGHVWRKAVGRIIGYDGDLAFRVSFFEAPCLLFIHIDGAEDEVHALCDFVYVLFRVENGEGGECGGNGPFKRPFSADGFPIRLSRGAPRSRQRGDAKPGMAFENKEKTLSYHAGGADDAYVVLFHSILL